MNETLTLSLQLRCVSRREGSAWVASCPSLRVVTEADSDAEARAALREALQLWLESCVRRNSLDEALTELGWIHPGGYLGEGVMAEEPSQPEEFPLELKIPAYQAAVFSDSAGR